MNYYPIGKIYFANREKTGLLLKATILSVLENTIQQVRIDRILP